MDYAATTPVDPKVLEEMKPYFSKRFGNASSLHSMGQEAKKAMEYSRSKAADLINAELREIIFTSGGTEANNFALKGVAYANRDKGNHIITSAIEHHAILDPLKWLEKNGFDVTILPVDKYGLVRPEQVADAITPKTTLVSIMAANNEIGTIEPIKEIGEICKDHDVYFHTDAVQAVGKIPIDVERMNIDLLSMSAHKIYGPKGVGYLYVRNGVKIDPLLHGGGQEFGLRSTTENVAGIVGFGKAIELRKREMYKEAERLKVLNDRMIKDILKIESSYLNGHPIKRLYNNANFHFDFIEGESLILRLDAKGIEASTGSACSSTSLEPSHVLLAIGLRHEQAHGSLRLTIGKWTKRSDVNYVTKVLPEVVEKLREISPFKKSW